MHASMATRSASGNVRPTRTDSPVSIVPGRLYALGGTVALDGRISWFPPDATGSAPTSCYLLLDGGSALLIDTGLPVHRDVLIAQLGSLLDPATRLVDPPHAHRGVRQCRQHGRGLRSGHRRPPLRPLPGGAADGLPPGRRRRGLGAAAAGTGRPQCRGPALHSGWRPQGAAPAGSPAQAPVDVLGLRRRDEDPVHLRLVRARAPRRLVESTRRHRGGRRDRARRRPPTTCSRSSTGSRMRTGFRSRTSWPGSSRRTTSRWSPRCMAA